MKTMRQNDRWRWLTAGAVAVCLLAFTLLIALLAWQGMRAFWPQRVDLYQLTQPEGQTTALLGETLEHQPNFPAPAAQGEALPPVSHVHRYLIKTGNRDWDAPDFRVIYAREALRVSQPKEVMVLQRRSGGNAYGWFAGLREDNEALTARDPDALLHQRLGQVRELLHKIHRIRHVDLTRLNDQLRRWMRAPIGCGSGSSSIRARCRSSRRTRRRCSAVSPVSAAGWPICSARASATW